MPHFLATFTVAITALCIWAASSTAIAENTPGDEAESASSQTALELPSETLAHYSLNEETGEVALDTLGNNIGSISGNPQWESTGGYLRGALRFDGSEDAITIEDIELASAQSLTLAAWVFPTSYDGYAKEARFISKASGIQNSQHYWMLGNFLDGSALRFRLKTDDGGTSVLVSSKGLLPLNSWSHVAATYDGSFMKLHLNGVEVERITKRGTIVSRPDIPVGLGNQPLGSGERGLIGLLDEVYVINKALSSSELAELMTQPDMEPTTPVADEVAPTVPIGLSATEISDDQISLSWSASEDDTGVVGYRVVIDGTEDEVTEETDFNHTGLTELTTYQYQVSAMDAANNESLLSTSVSVRTSSESDTEPPSIPSEFSARDLTPTSVTLNWAPSFDNLTDVSYRVVSEAGEVGTTLTNEFLVSGLLEGTTYQFQVSALDSQNNESTFSEPLTVTTPTSNQSSSKAIIAHWKFDEVSGPLAPEETGTYPGTLVGNVSWLPNEGTFGGAARFEGLDSGVQLGPLAPDTSNGMTLALWVRPSSFAGFAREARFISKASSTSSAQHTWMLSNFSDGTAVRFRLKTMESATKTLISPSGLLQLNVWSHVAATFDGTTMRIFVNGVEIAAQSNVGVIAPSVGQEVAIGNQPIGAGSRGFIGALDEVFILNRALSAQQLESLMPVSYTHLTLPTTPYV